MPTLPKVPSPLLRSSPRASDVAVLNGSAAMAMQEARRATAAMSDSPLPPPPTQQQQQQQSQQVSPRVPLPPLSLPGEADDGAPLPDVDALIAAADALKATPLSVPRGRPPPDTSHKKWQSPRLPVLPPNSFWRGETHGHMSRAYWEKEPEPDPYFHSPTPVLLAGHSPRLTNLTDVAAYSEPYY